MSVNSTVYSCKFVLSNEKLKTKEPIFSFPSSSSVIISVMTFEGTDCCLADIGRLADSTGGRVRHIRTISISIINDEQNTNFQLLV